MFIIDKIYVDTIGLTFRVDVGRDITGATNTELHVKKPDGTLVVLTASIVDLQYLEYITIAGDLDQIGIYRVQSSMTFSGWAGTGETCEFIVFELYQ